VADVLIHDIPDAVIDRIDSAAASAGLTRAEYLRRHIDGLIDDPAVIAETTVGLADLDRFASHFTDERDEDVLRDAWR